MDETAATPPPLTFLKLGGSLITDKNREATPRLQHLQRLATEIRTAMDARPEMRLLIGHGSGSFGHFVGRRYRTRRGVRSPQEWLGYTQVGAAAARLNRLVTDTLLKAGVPVLSIQPSASALCRDGTLVKLESDCILHALEQGLVPLVYGDVARDEIRGGTIISTEEVFLYLAPLLRPARIVLLGQVAGVLDQNGEVIPYITADQDDPGTLPLGDSHGVDVTGGMFSKVTEMRDLVSRHPAISVRILSGIPPQELQKTLIDPSYPTGTLLTAKSSPTGTR